MPDEPAHYIKSCANPLVDQKDGHYGHFYDSSLEDIAKHSPPAGKDKFNISKFFDTPISATEKQGFYSHALPNTSLVYAAPSIACHAMTALDISKQKIFYVMRLATLATFLALILLASKIHSEFFISLSPMLMLPMVINQSVAIGADYFSIGVCVLAATVIVSGARNPNINATLTAFTLFLLLNTKTAYLVFSIPLIWILIQNGIFFKIKSLLLHTFSGVLALIIQTFYLFRKTNDESVSLTAAKKIQQLFHDPTEFLVLVDASVGRHFWFYIESAIGKVGWLDTPLGWHNMFAFIFSAAVTSFIIASPPAWQRLLAMLLSSASTSVAVYAGISYRLKGILLSAAGYFIFMAATRKQHMQLAVRLMLLASILVSCLLVFLSMHIFWSPINSRYIDGVQGRYFLPILPFIIALLYLQQHALATWKKFALGGVFLFDLGITCIYLFKSVIPRFYG